ncbi:unnamed protein product, partial [marine sediment metagenome]
ILVVLIVGFIIGWGNIAPWLSGDNVDKIAQACASACTMQSVYDFCTKQRELKASDLPVDADGKAQKSITKSCNFFSTYKNKDGNTYGIEECLGLCDSVEPLQTCVELEGTLLTLTEEITDCSDTTTEIPSSDTTTTEICCKTIPE